MLRCSHERGSGFHQRDKVPDWADAPELPGCFVEGGEAPFEARRGRVSLDTTSTSVQLGEARRELQLMMRGIEGIEKLCELESEDDS